MGKIVVYILITLGAISIGVYTAISIDAGDEHMFGLMITTFGIWCLGMIVGGFIMNQLARFVPCSWFECYLPSAKKNNYHTCSKCGQKYTSKYGRKFGGFGMTWENDNR